MIPKHRALYLNIEGSAYEDFYNNLVNMVRFRDFAA